MGMSGPEIFSGLGKSLLNPQTVLLGSDHSHYSGPVQADVRIRTTGPHRIPFYGSGPQPQTGQPVHAGHDRPVAHARRSTVLRAPWSNRPAAGTHMGPEKQIRGQLLVPAYLGILVAALIPG